MTAPLFPEEDSRTGALHQRLCVFRDKNKISRASLAAQLGVTPATLHRWETGSALPPPLAAEKLRGMGFGIIAANETNIASVPKLKARAQNSRAEAHAITLRESGTRVFTTPPGDLNVLKAPFVRNGPPDQASFHEKMIDLQAASPIAGDPTFWNRLSMIEEVEKLGKTAQHLLENPRPTALSWNSNYGTHGWHRYVGRFPPHVIRALLNHFGANKGTVVCDPFAGSGTTAVECRLLGIPFVGVEICPLSCMMTRTKAAFPSNPRLRDLAESFSRFYDETWWDFLKGRAVWSISHQEVLERESNPITPFPNVERWFTPEALLGASITVQFGMSCRDFARDAVLLALSSKMRSIGNVDVDVVRAEYSREPRENVDVRRLVVQQLLRMADDIDACVRTHAGLIGTPESIELKEGSVLNVDLPRRSIDQIITSPPYGIEAISYLRTHLLSYRSLVAHLDHDPYQTRDKTIGSEYVEAPAQGSDRRTARVSPTCKEFFTENRWAKEDAKYAGRRAAMQQFCEDMLSVGERMSRWMRPGGRVAFIIGNKRLGAHVVPMDVIIKELFEGTGFRFDGELRHKLKTNNSNSQVPWQERIIQEESILLFTRPRGAK